MDVQTEKISPAFYRTQRSTPTHLVPDISFHFLTPLYDADNMDKKMGLYENDASISLSSSNIGLNLTLSHQAKSPQSIYFMKSGVLVGFEPTIVECLSGAIRSTT